MDKPAQPLPSETVERLRRLLRERDRADASAHEAKDELALEVRRLCDDEGVTVRAIAEALGVASSTVQSWIQRARQLRRP